LSRKDLVLKNVVNIFSIFKRKYHNIIMFIKLIFIKWKHFTQSIYLIKKEYCVKYIYKSAKLEGIDIEVQTIFDEVGEKG